MGYKRLRGRHADSVFVHSSPATVVTLERTVQGINYIKAVRDAEMDGEATREPETVLGLTGIRYGPLYRAEERLLFQL